ncbi:hypothetical protein GWI78_03610 [Proteus sp. G2658]|uniref:hypothetical protein n=1 Tax=Proteus sp. G2658 TaxID=2698871 RepID=UPI0013775B98|nr:hypothetical protein [Proteus sp. G2658]NBM89009.1 hypothetical protein [Proteus sp. G2658]
MDEHQSEWEEFDEKIKEHCKFLYGDKWQVSYVTNDWRHYYNLGYRAEHIGEVFEDVRRCM